jgi:hypothetical protein
MLRRYPIEDWLIRVRRNGPSGTAAKHGSIGLTECDLHGEADPPVLMTLAEHGLHVGKRVSQAAPPLGW